MKLLDFEVSFRITNIYRKLLNIHPEPFEREVFGVGFSGNLGPFRSSKLELLNPRVAVSLDHQNSGEGFRSLRPVSPLRAITFGLGLWSVCFSGVTLPKKQRDMYTYIYIYIYA